MAVTDNFADAVLHRTAEFVNPGVRWQRSLWNTGLVLCLKELIEASDAVQAGALSTGSIKWLANNTKGRVASDPGAGSPDERKAVLRLLSGDLSSGGANHRELRQWINAIEPSYLSRWAAAVSDDDRPSREGSARALAAHLLDLGFSSSALTSWLQSVEADNGAELFQRAAELAEAPGQTFEVMLLFEQPPPKRIARPPEWRDAPEVSGWLRKCGFGSSRQHGGLLLGIDAREPMGAAHQAADTVDRLLARVSVGTRGAVRVAPRAYIRGIATPVPLARTRRVEVRALEREDRLLHLERTGPVDDALELLSHLNGAPAPVAVTGGWSAIESLLSGSGDADKVVTAERLGFLVACSWPRAELTTLAWARQSRSPKDHLANALHECSSNRERSQMLLDELGTDSDLALEGVRDRLAQKRVEKLARAPRDGLLSIQRQAAASFRRLYRQRNLVAHGGQVAGVALSATLRTAAPITGAGLDRITHASLARGERPLDLAARARMEVERAGSKEAPSLTALLE
jgi:hypothetical protein